VEAKKYVSFSREVMNAGTSPLSALLDTSNVTNLVIFIIETGRVPEKRFDERSKVVMPVRAPIAEGICPFKLKPLNDSPLINVLPSHETPVQEQKFVAYGTIVELSTNLFVQPQPSPNS